MAVMDHCARSASVRAVEDCAAICISAANLYQVYARDLKQFALIQMNMGREVSRRLREADNRLFGAKMGASLADIDPSYNSMPDVSSEVSSQWSFKC